MEKYSQEWYEELYKWIKHKEFRADQKYWSMAGLDRQCPTSADLLLEEKNSIINDER